MSTPPPPLTVQSVHNTIDECLSNFDTDKSILPEATASDPISLRCRRGMDEDMNAIKTFCAQFRISSSSSSDFSTDATDATDATDTSTENSTATSIHPIHLYILLEEKLDNCDEAWNLKGVAVWYFGYSTWKGKVMNLDSLFTSTSMEEEIMMNALVRIAQCFDFGRIVYQIQGKSETNLFKEKHNVDILEEWVTLQMGRNEMSLFLKTLHTWDDHYDVTTTTTTTTTNISDKSQNQKKNCIPCNLEQIHDTIDDIMSKINPAVGRRKNPSGCSLRLRRSTTEDIVGGVIDHTAKKGKNDATSILNLVHGLALYEKALDEVHVNESIYQLDGSGENPLYHCILLEEVKGEINTHSDGNSNNRNDHNRNSNNSVNNEASTVVGMGFFYFGYSMEHNGYYLFLEDLFIEKEYRSNGYGKSIMYVLAMIAEELKCKQFVWQALDWNTPALTFYDSIGAEICNELITVRLDRERINK